MLFHFALFIGVNALGRPEVHVSTGIHQQIAARQTTAYDIMGWPREEELPRGGPHLASARDFAFTPAAESAGGSSDAARAALDAAVPLVEAAPEGAAAHWYTVYGKTQDDGGAALRVGGILASLGVAAFCLALRKDL